ncbi:AAA domain-containing protein [Pavlovales sp. CCMP2436]|nr:AAA domain-containing protein [Pavlovales sp. CCMP2436]
MTDGDTQWVIALTGGPCAGKTTAMRRLQAHFGALGMRVYLVPEAATIMWASGCEPSDLGLSEPRVAFQTGLMRLQLQLEDSIAAVARANGTKAVLLCDRGLMDGKAYMSDAEWQRVLDNNKLAEEECNMRYDCVIHLVTAAEGASEHYVASQLRRETAEQAVAVEKRTLEVWAGHLRRSVVDNSTGMDGKLARVVDAASAVMLSSHC